MKTAIFLIIALFTIAPMNAFAEYEKCKKLTSCDSIYHNVGSWDYCSADKEDLECRTGVATTSSHFYRCSSCQGNRELVHVDPQGCEGILDPTECQCPNKCKDTDWAATGTDGYQSRIDCGASCDNTPKYRCDQGFYGTSTNGTSGCKQCPEWDGVYTTSGQTTKIRGTTSGPDTRSIAGCFIKANTYYDKTGTFKITSQCNHTTS